MNAVPERENRGGARLLADTGHTLGSSVYLLLLGIATSIVLARYLGPEGKGAYDLLWLTGQLFSVLGGLSLSSGIMFYAARGTLHAQAVLRTLGLFTLGLTAMGAAALWASRGTPIQGFLLPPGAGLAGAVAVVLLVGVLAATEHWRALAVGLGKIAAANRRDLVREILFLVLLGLAAWVGAERLGVARATAAIWAAVGASLVGGLLLLGLVRSGPEDGSVGFRGILRYSVPAHSSNIAQFLNYRLDFFLVSYFAGVAALGQYSVAVGLSQLLWIGSRAASRVLLPAVAASEGDAGVDTAIVARLGFWTAGAGALAYLLVGPFLISGMYGPAFLPSHLPLMILLVGTVPFTLSNTLAAHLGGLGLPHLNLRASLVGLVVTVVLDLLLIPPFGIAGAAAATSASYLATTAVLVYFFAGRSPVKVRELVLLRRTDLAVAAQVARGAGTALLGRTPS